jgi:hypothetical protein
MERKVTGRRQLWEAVKKKSEKGLDKPTSL